MPPSDPLEGPATCDLQPATPSTPPPAEKRARNVWVENIEVLVSAGILALILRTFVLGTFVIPTGSMAATLYGEHFDMTCSNCGYRYALGFEPGGAWRLSEAFCPNCGLRAQRMPGSPAGGDRIVCDKVCYQLEKPNRWDPFVFVNPTATLSDNPPKTTYIKRLVGMPGEKLEIIRGDVVVNGQIRRKPAEVQERLWMPVYDAGCPWKEGSPWTFPDRTWSLEGKRLVADCPPSLEPAWAEFTVRETHEGEGEGRENFRGIFDHYGYDRGRGLNVVTDLRVSFDLKAAAGGLLVVSLLNDEGDDEAVIDLTGEGKASITRAGKLVVRPVEVPALRTLQGQKHHISFYRVDYLLVLAIDGKVALQYDFWSDREYRRLSELGLNMRLEGYHTSGVRLGAANAKLALEDLRIDRDIYYTYRAQMALRGNHYDLYLIPEDAYFALGDNSPNSLDSRYWGVVPGRNLIGKAVLVWWSPSRIGLVH